MKSVAATSATPAFDIVGKTFLSPKVWLDDVYRHVNPSKTLTAEQWQGVRDALEAVFRTYDSKNHLLFDKFDDAVKGIEVAKVDNVGQITALQTLLNRMSEADGYEIEMIQYANAIRTGIFGPMSNKDDFSASEKEMMIVGCLLISREMGFSAEQVRHAQDLKNEIEDTVTGDHAGRIKRAVDTLTADYNYGTFGPTELRKASNHLFAFFGWRG